MHLQTANGLATSAFFDSARVGACLTFGYRGIRRVLTLWDWSTGTTIVVDTLVTIGTFGRTVTVLECRLQCNQCVVLVLPVQNVVGFHLQC